MRFWFLGIWIIDQRFATTHSVAAIRHHNLQNLARANNDFCETAITTVIVLYYYSKIQWKNEVSRTSQWLGTTYSARVLHLYQVIGNCSL